MGKSQKPVQIEKEEEKLKAATVAASKRAKGSKVSMIKQAKYYGTVGVAVVVCLLAVFLAVSGPSAAKKGAETPLDKLVNDAYNIQSVTTSADGNFTAAASPFFDKWTFGDVKWGHAGISLSKMVGLTGAIQVCDAEEGVEGGALPPAYDARDNWPGCFGDVYDSGNCSASYATAAADSIAARFCIQDNEKHGSLRLSPQQVLSCDKKSHGCKGGGVDSVWAYIQRRGLYPEECLPYVGEKGTKCKTECKEEQKMKVLDHCVMRGDQKAIKREIFNRGPVVAPMFLKSDYLVYSNGVYSPTEQAATDFLYDAEGKNIMHAVSVLGWGKSHGNPYWLVRHSWGSNWGENGYARVSMGSVLHEGSIIKGTVATEQAIVDAEQKKQEAEARKEEARKDRAARDERIRLKREEYDKEQAAQKEADDLKDMDDEDFESEVDLDADLNDDDDSAPSPAPTN